MSDELLDRARQLLAGITAAPWVAGREVDGVNAGRDTVVRAGGRRIVTVHQARPHHQADAEANVAFIAAAPTLVADLLARLELAEARTGWRDAVQQYTQWQPGDPCCVCSSTETGLDEDGVPFCGNCNASDGDE